MSQSDRTVVTRHLESLLETTNDAHIPEDVVGRLLVEAAIGLWRNARSVDDIASELNFIIDNLDDDTEYPFMRP